MDSNRRQLVLEVTTLPTEPQPLTKGIIVYLLSEDNVNIFKETVYL